MLANGTQSVNGTGADSDSVDCFLPWSGNVPESCRMAPGAAAKAAETADDPIVDIDRGILDDEVANNANRDWEDSQETSRKTSGIKQDASRKAIGRRPIL